jgi:hypothetical protein
LSKLKPVSLKKWASATPKSNNGKPTTKKSDKNEGIVRKRKMPPSFTKKTVSMKIVLPLESKTLSGRMYSSPSAILSFSQALRLLLEDRRLLPGRWFSSVKIKSSLCFKIYPKFILMLSCLTWTIRSLCAILKLKISCTPTKFLTQTCPNTMKYLVALRMQIILLSMTFGDLSELSVMNPSQNLTLKPANLTMKINKVITFTILSLKSTSTSRKTTLYARMRKKNGK